jgi:hypothetical protein
VAHEIGVDAALGHLHPVLVEYPVPSVSMHRNGYYTE